VTLRVEGDVLSRERAVVPYGVDDLRNGGAGHPGVTGVVDDGRVGGAIDHVVAAVGRQSGQFVLRSEPVGALLAGGDDGTGWTDRLGPAQQILRISGQLW
jgi:hypothetical protein